MERHSNTARKRLYADIHRLLATLMQSEVSDPRLRGVCITRIEAKPAGHDVTVWVHRPDDEDHEACERRLNTLAPYLMRRLGRALPKSRLPRLHFHWDDALDKGDAVLSALRRMEERGS